MSISKFTAALASGSAELTVALANLNLDVSLIKMEAPAEYRPLELALSTKTKDVAESGPIQACARKLQALFSPILPRIPSLHRAYGTRASEIAGASKSDTSGSAAHGPFADHVGIDGGSLWAAARSGQGAVAVHLLACMLARMFPAVEAASIWEEIVTVRKNDILQSEVAGGADASNVFAVLAAKTPLARRDLELWDASARAWLRSADEVMEKKQKQLLLIINNINLPVNRHSSTFANVTQAWTTAMAAVDRLVEGMPHSIVDGAVLVALSAWHLYPDMMVLGEKSTMVKQHDSLLKPEGILTLGLESVHPGAENPSQGISWSLPLACYYYYGGAVTAEQTLADNGSRLSLSRMLVVALGSVFSGWSEPRFEPLKAARLIRSIWTLVNRPSQLKLGTKPSPKSWLALLAKAGDVLLNSEGPTLEELCRLFKYGRRNCAGFVALANRRDGPFVQLREPQTLLPMMMHASGRIKVLRQCARRLNIEPHRLIIRYAISGPSGGSGFGYATVVSTRLTGNAQVLRRWENEVSGAPEKGETTHLLEKKNIVNGPPGLGDKWRRFFWVDAPAEVCVDGYASVTIDEFFGRFAEFAMYKGRADPENPRRLVGLPCHLIFGDPSSAALYQTYEPSPDLPSVLLTDDLETAFDEGEVSVSRLLTHLADKQSSSRHEVSDHVRALKAIATIGALYEELPKATIAMGFVKSALVTAQWLTTALGADDQEHDQLPDRVGSQGEERNGGKHLEDMFLAAFEPAKLSRPAKFACIAMLESGSVNIGPSGLEAVMAMSSGDSLYIASELLHDPGHQHQSDVIRIRGNIGREGITMLIPPSTKLRRTEAEDWRRVEHAYFDSQRKDSFEGTSLHLSFTDYSLVIDTGKRGVRSSEVQLLETVISVHDRGRWVADLDILSTFTKPLFRCVRTPSDCRHTDKNLVLSELVALDTWEEFLDRPSDDVVFRAHHNWQARLAATALSVARGDLTIVLAAEPCWACGEAERGRLRHKDIATYIM